MLVVSSHQALRSAALAGEGGSALTLPRVVVIGNFDGVHLGHQALFAHARRCLPGGIGTVIAMTFWPHPARVLASASSSGSSPQLILGQKRRRERLCESGVDVLVEQPFELSFASLSPTEFVDDVLVGSLGARWVVVGHDFTFGKGRAGNTETLRQLLARHGAEASLMPPYTVPDPETGEPILCSSTFVRREVQAGRLERAALVLGCDFESEGEVVHGAARGRTLGFPTANLRPDAELRPAVGIYAAWADVLAPESDTGQFEPQTAMEVAPRKVLSRHPAAVSVGYNATFTASSDTVPPLSIEAHLIQPPGAPPLSLYGQTVRLAFRSRLRDELRFSSVEALVEQIQRDVDQAKECLGITGKATGAGTGTGAVTG